MRPAGRPGWRRTRGRRLGSCRSSACTFLEGPVHGGRGQHPEDSAVRLDQDGLLGRRGGERPESRRPRGVDPRSLWTGEAETVCDRIPPTGAPGEVRAEARERVDRAKAALRDSGVGGEELQMLELVADGVVERYS